MLFRTIKEANITRGTRVIVRADFDVPMSNGRIADDFRIRQVLPTLRFILKKGGKVRILSYIGRPGGKPNPLLSMKRIARVLARLLRRKVIFVPDVLDETAFRLHDTSPEIIFFENIRFWPGEEKNDVKLARRVSRWGDLFINEAFANAHRNHACVTTLARLLPSYAGLRFAAEVENLSELFSKPKRPFVAVLGGVKFETKLPLIERFVRHADIVLIGGALANTCFALQDFEVGKSSVTDETGNILLRKILFSPKLHLPSDVVAAETLDTVARYRTVKAREVDKKEYIVDLGPESVKLFSSLAHQARTLVWNGPLGYVEVARFAEGTKRFVQSLARTRAFKVVGGGDSVAFLKKYKLLKNFTYVSTSGGAMMEFLAGKKLPGVEVLRK